VRWSVEVVHVSAMAARLVVTGAWQIVSLMLAHGLWDGLDSTLVPTFVMRNSWIRLSCSLYSLAAMQNLICSQLLIDCSRH